MMFRLSESRSTPHSHRHTTVAMIAIAMTVARSGLAPAAELQIDGSRCSSEIRLIARDVPLSDVLARLAKILDFRLYFRSNTDPLVSVDTAREPKDVILQLTPSGNVSIMQGAEPRCQGQRVLSVWVLNGPSLGKPTTSDSQVSVLKQASERANLEQKALELHFKAHGVDSY
jgi:hypothetical protein